MAYAGDRFAGAAAHLQPQALQAVLPEGVQLVDLAAGALPRVTEPAAAGRTGRSPGGDTGEDARARGQTLEGWGEIAEECDEGSVRGALANGRVHGLPRMTTPREAQGSLLGQPGSASVMRMPNGFRAVRSMGEAHSMKRAPPMQGRQGWRALQGAKSARGAGRHARAAGRRRQRGHCLVAASRRMLQNVAGTSTG